MEEFNEYKEKAKEDPIWKEEADYNMFEYHSVTLKRRKISHYIREAFNQFSIMVAKIIKSGVMHRLFAQFDFCSTSDRDCTSPRSHYQKKTRAKP